ncbi:MAG: beta-galactosidase small subunit [Chitinophagales bacterium]|nr:beta-galactosidase small subunit [Chitinophagales bacterium]MDW8420037.1 hypothetical protein [Chitinophagales bacterium]
MKKTIFAAAVLVVLAIACNKTAFIKKLTGVWKLNRYLYDGKDQTLYFDTTFRFYQLTIDNDNRFTETWKVYTFYPDSLIKVDTLGYDTINSQYILDYDTLRWLDTVITPFMTKGEWQLINSEEDLQLRDDSATTARIYRILDLTPKALKLRKGNEELYLGK